jgi:hypothetical protein
MAEKKKSIIEEALLEARSLEDALKANTKEILAATMRQEIESIVESSLREQEDEEEEEMNDVEIKDLDDEAKEEESEEGSEESEEMVDMESGEELEGMEDMESEESEEGSEEEMGDMESGEESLDMMGDLEDLNMGDEFGDESEQKVIDLRGASDAKVAKVFKRMNDEDEIEVVKNGNDLNLKENKTGAEYHIQIGESYGKMEEDELCEECGDKMYEEDETMYEIELDEESDLEEFYFYGDKEEEEEKPIEEDRNKAHRRLKYHGASKHPREFSRDYSGVAESRKVSKPVVKESTSTKVSAIDSKILKEYEELKAKNEEYKKALTIFKTKLNEVALFNNNLALVTKLFTEHSTTKKEKMEILKKFDSVQSLKESKNLYKTISSDLEGRTPLNESVEKKVIKSINKGSSNLNESTAYVDPQINKIKEMMRKLS